MIAKLGLCANYSNNKDCFSSTNPDDRNWDLVIVGTGAQRDRVFSTIKEQGLDERVHCAGFKNGDEIIPYYTLLDACFAEHKRESWGLVVNEAMACGLPVICSIRCECYDDVISEGETGFGIEPDSTSMRNGTNLNNGFVGAPDGFSSPRES